MYSFVRPNLSAATNPFSRWASSLGPGRIVRGTRADYRALNAVIGGGKHSAIDLKSDILPRDKTGSAQLTLSKSAPRSMVFAFEKLRREIRTYHNSEIHSAESLRKMSEAFEDTIILLGWLDETLSTIECKPDKWTYNRIALLLRLALDSCVVLEGHGPVDRDTKPNNALACVQSGNIAAQLRGLGSAVPASFIHSRQPCALRAPEVYLEQPCGPSSQVWATAAMFFCWVKPSVWGSANRLHGVCFDEVWAMVKIKSLFPNWDLPNLDGIPTHMRLHRKVKLVRQSAECDKDARPPGMVSSFDQEVQEVGMPEELKKLLRFMLVPNAAERPLASTVLASQELRAFEDLIPQLPGFL